LHSTMFPNSSYLHVIDVVPVPCCAKELVTESEDEDVFDHLLAQVVIDTVKLVFGPVGGKRALKLSGAGEVLAEWLLDLLSRLAMVVAASCGGATYNHARDAILGVAVALKML
jgi:hypothetical protein